jgi:hypothetical protein
MTSTREVRLSIPVKTTNPNNNSQGITRGAMFAKAKVRKGQRALAGAMTRSVVGLAPWLSVTVTLTRVAPSSGLDPHDGLGPALKGVADGITDGLGLANDRDPRIVWAYAQRRGKPKEYAVEVVLIFVRAERIAGTA